MAEIFTMIMDFMRTTAISFDFNGNTYSFTFWSIALAIMVIDVGILIIRRISS